MCEVKPGGLLESSDSLEEFSKSLLIQLRWQDQQRKTIFGLKLHTLWLRLKIFQTYVFQNLIEHVLLKLLDSVYRFSSS
jgi:hypothetical protein